MKEEIFRRRKNSRSQPTERTQATSTLRTRIPWAKAAKELRWLKPWKKVLEWKSPWAKWFIGGRIPLTTAWIGVSKCLGT
jgi:acetyl-CoA synthetase